MSAYDNIYKTKLIYVMTIPDQRHNGLLKVGEATVDSDLSFDRLNPNCKELNDSAKKRIKEYTNTAGVEFTLLHTELAVRMVAKDKRDIQMEMFSDDDIKKVLENSGYKHVKLGTTTADEWYKITLDTARAAIKAYKDGYKNLSNALFRQGEEVKPLELREEQLDAVDKTIKAYKRSDNYLWNAKMRFGKTISALEVVKRMQFAKTIIITHRPVVDEGWYEDFKKVFAGDSECIYGSKKKGYEVKDLLKTGKRFVYFASIQDLRGSKAVGKKFAKNDDVFDTDWDFVIVDEAHEGTKTALGDEVIKKIIGEGEEKRAKFLALSGTAFNLISDFDDTNVYTWDYIMEQAAKQAWYQTHCGEHNPYEVLPSMEIRTYDLDELLTDAYLDIEDKAFNFREFFRVWTGDKNKDKREIPVSGLKGEFIHKKDVQKFLDLLVAKDDKNNYPFSTEEYRSLFQHSLWIVPGVKEAAALSKLLQQHKVFGNGAFNIVNVAGAGDFDDNSGEEDLEKVKNAIADCGEGQYTITLSCGKLTQGVTVPEWTAVFMLAGSYSTSAIRYLQTIFRVQSPCVKGGLMKTKCYVFDFAPDRTLKMMAQAAAISGKPGKTKMEDRESLQQLLNFCPVIGLKGGRMVKYNTDKLLQQLKKAYAERAVEHGFDDSNIYNDSMLTLNDMDIKQFENLRAIIGTTKAMPKTKEIQISENGLTEEKYKELEKLNKKPKRELTPEEEARLKALQEAKKQRNVAISILRGISIRMPLLIYGAEIDAKAEITLEKFPDLIDENSWKEFMPDGITKKLFAGFTKYYDEDVFIAAGKKIRAIALSADELPPLGRVEKISRLFANFKNPDKETVLTPWRVVNMHMSDTLGGYDFFDKEHKEQIPEPRWVEHKGITEKTFGNVEAKILEINSKTGLYPLYATYSIFATKCKAVPEGKLNEKKQQELWDDTVRNNIYVVCKTKMAKTITQRTLAGYRNIKCNTHSFDDLINMIQNKSESFKKKVVTPQFWGKEGTTMKFDAIIGNPPYQISDGGGTGDSAKPIYNLFIQSAIGTNPDFLSMIVPSRWMKGGKGLDNFRQELMSDTRFVYIHDYQDPRECFPNVHIDGGVMYFLWSSKYDGKVNYTYKPVDEDAIQTQRYLKTDYSETIIRDHRQISIIEKTSKNKIKFNAMVSVRNPYGIYADLFNNPEKYPDLRLCYTPKDRYSKVYGVEGIKGGAKRKIGYIKTSKEITAIEGFDKYKLFFSKAYMTTSTIPPEIIIGEPNVLCTETFLQLGTFCSLQEANNCLSYIKSKFFRALLFYNRNSLNISRETFCLIPIQDFTSKSDIDWSKDITEIDKQLYKKYKLTEDEIAYIESHIKPMRGAAEESEEYLYTTRNGIQAKAEYIDEKRFKLFAGSQVDMTKEVDIKKTVALAKRKDLLDSGNIVKKNGKFYTNIDIEFNSPSAASDFVLGGSTNGWKEWKDESGRTLEELYRQ